jgi:hypothetical protein
MDMLAIQTLPLSLRISNGPLDLSRPQSPNGGSNWPETFDGGFSRWRLVVQLDTSS